MGSHETRKVLRNIGWVSAGITVLALSVVVGRELRQRKQVQTPPHTVRRLMPMRGDWRFRRVRCSASRTRTVVALRNGSKREASNPVVVPMASISSPIFEAVPPALPAASPERLRDSHGRAITDLRVSVTDRCNYRCVYCRTGNDGAQYSELPIADYARIIRVFVSLGIEKVRLTGGEPLLRKGLVELIEEIFGPDPKLDIALTTNGTPARRPSPPPSTTPGSTASPSAWTRSTPKLSPASPAFRVATNVCLRGVRAARSRRSRPHKNQRRPAAWLQRQPD